MVLAAVDMVLVSTPDTVLVLANEPVLPEFVNEVVLGVKFVPETALMLAVENELLGVLTEVKYVLVTLTVEYSVLVDSLVLEVLLAPKPVTTCQIQKPVL